MKDYTIEVKVKWVQIVTARNKAKAIEQLKDTFDEEFNFMPDDKEIKILSVKNAK